jgi:hypothetical protein
MAKLGAAASAENALDICPVFCNTPASIRRQARRGLPDRSHHSRLRFFGTIPQRTPVMFQTIAKPLLIGAVLIGLVCASQSAYAGWSLNPFASSDKPQTETRPVNSTKKPSALDKVAAGTKNFVNKTGEALHLKKPQPKKPPAVVAVKPRVVPQRYKEKKSWFSWLKPKEPPPEKSVSEWIGKTKQVTP